jgi:GNAT superfamily N-acetyltransferase
MSAISQDVSSVGMAAAIEANWIGGAELWSRVPITELHNDDPDLRWYTTPGVPFPPFNRIYWTRLPQEGIDVRIEEVRQHFAAHQVPFLWSVGPFSRPSDLGRHLESYGLARVDEMPGMAVDLQALNEDVPFPAKLEIERASDTEMLREYIEVARIGFKMPEFTSKGFFELYTAVGLTEESPWRYYVGRLGGEVVATATLALVGGVAGVYNAATLPKAGRQGLGAAMTLRVLCEARELGYRIGILQSSALGFNVYRRLGFEQYSTYSMYVGSRQE